MPAIVLFGRRWRVGLSTDDFVFSSFAEILLRTAWLVIFAVIVDIDADETCPKRPELLGFYIGMVCVLSLSIIVCVITMSFSMQGTIADAHPRRHVAKVLIVKVLLFIVELGFVAFGTYLAFGADTTNCSKAAIDTLRVFVIVMWIVFGFLIVWACTLFDPRGKLNIIDTELNKRDRKSWIRRWLICLAFCCRVNIRSDRTSDALDGIATLITDYLSGVDFVTSDVTAGLLLVQEEQKQRNRFSVFASTPYSPPPTALVVSSPKIEMNIPSAFHFMNFAMGSYGWPLFVYCNRCTCVCKLAAGCKCCSCIRTSGEKKAAEGDNCCSCNTSAITQQTGISSEDIIYANFTNEIHEVPFYVAIDKGQEAVVVAVRGTLSVKDLITDLNAGLEDLDVDGVSDAKAHKGILKAAHYIKTKISSTKINSPGLLQTAYSTHPGYRLVLTGHSLGAGVAAILAVLLRTEFPQLICFAFSPPGWLLSLSLSRYTESFVCSVVVGVHIIPRLGIATLEKLKKKMTKAINSCNRPKYQVLGREILNTVFCSSNPSEENVDATTEFQSNSRIDMEASNLEETNQHVDVSCNNSESGLQDKLFLPGRVLYLHEVEPKRGCRGVPAYKVYWRKPESFDEILLNRKKWFCNHFPDVVLEALSSANQNCVVSQCAVRPLSSPQPIRTDDESRFSQ